MVGGRRFEALSIAYLTAHPSRSFTLRNLGSKLPEWLAAHPELAGRRHRLAVDVARIEWAFVEAFDSAERTRSRSTRLRRSMAIRASRLQPHLRLIALEYPADDLVLGLHEREKRQTSEAGVEHDDEADAPVEPAADCAASPHGLPRIGSIISVYYRRLEREEFQMLAAIREGLPLGEAIEAGFAGSHIGEARRAERVHEWFANWAELGWICAPDLESLL